MNQLYILKLFSSDLVNAWESYRAYQDSRDVDQYREWKASQGYLTWMRGERDAAYFLDKEKPFNLLLERGHNVVEGYYIIALLVKKNFDQIDSVSWPSEDEDWFEFNQETGNYQKIERPDWAKGTVF